MMTPVSLGTGGRYGPSTEQPKRRGSWAKNLPSLAKQASDKKLAKAHVLPGARGSTPLNKNALGAYQPVLQRTLNVRGAYNTSSCQTLTETPKVDGEVKFESNRPRPPPRKHRRRAKTAGVKPSNKLYKETETGGWKKSFIPRKSEAAALSERFLTLDDAQVHERAQFTNAFVNHNPLKGFLPKNFSHRKLMWCYVPPHLRMPVHHHPESDGASSSDEAPDFDTLPTQTTQTHASLVKDFKKHRKKLDWTDIMDESSQLVILDRMIDNDDGERYDALEECHTFFSSSSTPVDSMGCNDCIAFFKEMKVLDDEVTSTFISQLFVKINVAESNRMKKLTGKKVQADKCIDLKELLDMTVNVAIKKFGELGPTAAVEKMWQEHVFPFRTGIVTPEDLRNRIIELNAAHHKPGDIRELFFMYKPKLLRMFKHYGGATKDAKSRDDSALDLQEVELMCKEKRITDLSLTKRGLIFPFALSRDQNSNAQPIALKFISFVEFVIRLACIKYGNNELALLAGKSYEQSERPRASIFLQDIRKEFKEEDTIEKDEPDAAPEKHDALKVVSAVSKLKRGSHLQAVAPGEAPARRRRSSFQASEPRETEIHTCFKKFMVKLFGEI